MSEVKDKLKEEMGKNPDLFAKVKALVFGENKEEKFEDAKMVDGTILRIEPSIEVGATVQVIGEDGELMAAPDGEHELESGQIVKTEGGLVLEIMGGEQPEEEEMETEAPSSPSLNVDDITAQISNKLTEAIIEKVNNLKFAKEEQIETLTETVNTLKAENETLKKELAQSGEKFKAMFELVEQIADQPSATPKKETKNAFKKKGKLTLKDFKTLNK